MKNAPSPKVTMSNITGGTWVAVQRRRQAPWTNETIEVWLITTDARPNGPEIAYIFGSKADAELIAAAPEMFKLIKKSFTLPEQSWHALMTPEERAIRDEFLNLFKKIEG